MGIGRAGLIAILMLAGVALLLLLNTLFPINWSDEFNLMSLVYGLILLMIVGSSIVSILSEEQLSTNLKYALTWIAIGLLLVVGYSYRAEFNDMFARVSGELAPSTPRVVEPGLVILSKSDDGHFYAIGQVNGVRVRFLVDTGASQVALTAADAERSGFDLDTLTYDQLVNTANGTKMSAAIRLDNVKIGDIELRNVRGSVSPEGLDISLLGMSFLGELTSIETRGDKLILLR